MLAIRLLAMAAAAVIALGLVGLAGPVAPAGAEESKADEPKKAEQKKVQITTTKVEGTDNVYIFRNGNHQAMFVVTKQGVIATDPVAYGRPTGAQDYINEIRKITEAPIRFLVYSHHHLDHIAGGKAFKDAGATIIAHRNVKPRLKAINHPNTPLPDRDVGNRGVVAVGGTTVELHYLGLNHSDSTLVMRLPREKIIFVVDSIPVGTLPGRGMIDFYPLESEQFLKRVLAMDWERLIPGHPGAPGGRLGTKKDVEEQLKILQAAAAEGRRLGEAGKCWEPGEKEFTLKGYESWPNYGAALPFIARRYCGLYGRGT